VGHAAVTQHLLPPLAGKDEHSTVQVLGWTVAAGCLEAAGSQSCLLQVRTPGALRVFAGLVVTLVALAPQHASMCSVTGGMADGHTLP
jgi:hypothetical protein